ncbi:hypothetical protein V6R21_04490 [Limibacter armeniacum]|uniref:hypothetical protein n=1 Tax=Limibacter armeniacum TaxID=466084 RepID=UPI002FE6202D
MIRYVLLLLLIIPFQSIHGQVTSKSLGISGGKSYLNTYDQLLNRFSYSGNSSWTFGLKGEWQNRQSIMAIDLEATSGKIAAAITDSPLYEYNFIRLQQWVLAFTYLREIPLPFQHFQTYIGLGYQTGYLSQEQHYKNLLYTYGEGYRKSYCVSLGSLSLNLVSKYHFKQKNTLTLGASYSLISLVARPDDNYVKQLNQEDEPEWHWFSVKDGQTYQLDITYSRLLTQHLGITLGFHSSQEQYHYRDKLVIRSTSLLVGVQKFF